jgi:putative flippase GtrA
MNLLTLDNYQRRTNSLFRFLLVGVVNTVVGLSTMYILLNGLAMSYYLSTFLGNGIGALVSYFLNRRFTFNSTVSLNKGAPKFILVILICYYVAYTVSSLATIQMGSYHLFTFSVGEEEVAVLLGTGLYTILNFLGQKYFVFRQRINVVGDRPPLR